MHITDLQEGMLYEPSELGIALLSGSGPPLILFCCNEMEISGYQEIENGQKWCDCLASYTMQCYVILKKYLGIAYPLLAGQSQKCSRPRTLRSLCLGGEEDLGCASFLKPCPCQHKRTTILKRVPWFSFLLLSPGQKLQVNDDSKTFLPNLE